MIVSYGRMSEKSPKIFSPSLKWPNNSLDFYRSKVSTFLFRCASIFWFQVVSQWVRDVFTASASTGLSDNYKPRQKHQYRVVVRCSLLLLLLLLCVWVIAEIIVNWEIENGTFGWSSVELWGKLLWVSDMALLCWVEVRCDEQNKWGPVWAVCQRTEFLWMHLQPCVTKQLEFSCFFSQKFLQLPICYH